MGGDYCTRHHFGQLVKLVILAREIVQMGMVTDTNGFRLPPPPDDFIPPAEKGKPNQSSEQIGTGRD